MIMKNNRLRQTLLSILIILILAFLALFIWSGINPVIAANFDGERAYKDVVTQVNFGARIPDSQAHDQPIKYIQLELKKVGWVGSLLEQKINGHTAYTILATRNSSVDPVVLLGAHYDSRIYADNDPLITNHTKPLPGADDGASSVAVVLELARSLPKGIV